MEIVSTFNSDSHLVIRLGDLNFISGDLNYIGGYIFPFNEPVKSATPF